MIETGPWVCDTSGDINEGKFHPIYKKVLRTYMLSFILQKKKIHLRSVVYYTIFNQLVQKLE
jgi:hypothetical protein